MEHAHGLTIPRTLQEARDAEALALIVYDMQAGIVGQLPDGPRIAARVGEVLDVARRAAVRIFFTRHLSLPVEVAGVGALRAAMAWQHRDSPGQVVAPFPRDSPQFQIVTELAPRPSEAICDKITMSAFAGTFLDIALRDCGIRTFLIAGIAVEVGIEPTVRHATDLGYLSIIVTDACGHGNAAAARRALDSLAFAGGSIQTDIAAMRAALDTTTPAPEPSSTQS